MTPRQAIDTFLSIHQESVLGSLTTFDRMIFKGHLTMFYPKGAFARFLNRQGVLLKEFKPYVEGVSQQIKRHSEELAQQAGRPFRYLEMAMTTRNGQGKEELAKQIAEEAHITEGLICVFSTLEPCSTFTVRGNWQTQRLEVVRRNSKCLHFYFYYLDAELGFMHIRLQSWFPYQIQVYVNGRECLSRYLDQQNIAYERYDNTFTRIDNLAEPQVYCEKFAHFDWPPLFNALAERLKTLSKPANLPRNGYLVSRWLWQPQSRPKQR